MKQLFLYGGITVIGYALWKNRQNPSVGTEGLTRATGIAVSPSTLVVAGSIDPSGDTACGPCVSVASIGISGKGLGTDSRISTPVGRDSPDSVSYSFGREDFSGVNPFSM